MANIILYYVPLTVNFLCLLAISKQKSSYEQKLMTLFLSTEVVSCVGFVFQSEAQSLGELVKAYRLIFIAPAASLYFLILFYYRYCKRTLTKVIKNIIMVTACLMVVAEFTFTKHSLFIRKYWAVKTGRYYILKCEKGILYKALILLVLIYFIWVTILFTWKLKRTAKEDRRIGMAIMMLLVILLPVVPYFVETNLKLGYQYMPLGYMLSSICLMYLIYAKKIYDVSNRARNFVFETATEGIIIMDEKNNFVGCNEKGEMLFPEIVEARFGTPVAELSKELKYILDGRMKAKRVDETRYDITIAEVTEGNKKEKVGSVIRFTDVTLRHEYEKLMERNMRLDGLTELLNKQSFEKDVKNELSRSMVGMSAMIFMDLDHFKTLNDTLGHMIGDQAIRDAAETLKTIFPKTVPIGRFGGDEFCVFLSHIGRSDLTSYLNALHDSIIKTYTHDGESVQITASIGAVLLVAGKKASYKDLMTAADNALYRSKEAGRNRFTVVEGTEPCSDNQNG